MMTGCSQYDESISLYIDGFLPEDDAQALEAHVATCEYCTKRLAELQAITKGIESMQVTPPAGLHESIMGAVRASAGPAKKKTVSFLSGRVLAYAAACAVLLLVLSTTLFGDLSRTYLFGFLHENRADSAAGAAPADMAPQAFTASSGADMAANDELDGGMLSALPDMAKATDAVQDNALTTDTAGETATAVDGADSRAAPLTRYLEGENYAFLLIVEQQDGTAPPLFFEHFKRVDYDDGVISFVLYNNDKLFDETLDALAEDGYAAEILTKDDTWHAEEADFGLVLMLPPEGE